MTWTEITTLVERAQAGDRAAYGELVERFQPTVYAVALARLRNPAEAQELAQEVFLHGMKKLAQLRDPQCFAGWLRQITVRMAINRLTRRGPLHERRAARCWRTPRRPASVRWSRLVRAEQAAELYGGLERLKPVDRATLVAFYIRGRSLEADEPRVRDAGRHHQAPAARRPQASEDGPGEAAASQETDQQPRRPRELACV